MPEDSEVDISQFIKVLPQICSQLKFLNLGYGLLGKLCDLSSISSIVNTCLDLEELNISGNLEDEKAISYFCENLTSNILKLDIRYGKINDNNIRALVKKCPKLKVLDIRDNENVTYQGVVSIIESLNFLECLGLPESIPMGGRAFSDFASIGKINPSPTYVWDDTSIRAAAGVGITYVSPFGPIGIDAALPIRKEDYDITEKLHFNFGTRF
jgi:hypothetical protein